MQAKAVHVGEGNLSEGVRRALAAFAGKSDSEVAQEYARYLRGPWEDLGRAKANDSANVYWVASRMKRDWDVVVFPGVAAMVLEILRSPSSAAETIGGSTAIKKAGAL